MHVYSHYLSRLSLHLSWQVILTVILVLNKDKTLTSSDFILKRTFLSTLKIKKN